MVVPGLGIPDPDDTTDPAAPRGNPCVRYETRSNFLRVRQRCSNTADDPSLRAHPNPGLA